MTWNYRIVRYRGNKAYGLHEVYYDDQGLPQAMTADPTTFGADEEEGPAGVIAALEVALKDARERPVFDEPEKGEWPGKPIGT